MNDSDLGTAVLESVAEVRSATPVGQIIGRGRTIRARRRIPQAAGAALTVAAGAALAVTTISSGSSGWPSPATASNPGSASNPSGARLTAWTVAKQANGDIHITVNQLKDPAGLQATLRADGLPAIVSFAGPALSTSCQEYPVSRGDLQSVAQFHGTGGITIHPSALPRGAGVFIFDRPGTGSPANPLPAKAPGGTPPLGHLRTARLAPPTLPTGGPLAVGLVYASQQCTG